MSLDFLFKNYKNYLIANKITNDASAKSYVSYLRGLFLEMFGEKYDEIDFIKSSSSSTLYEQYIAYTAEYLRNGIDHHSSKYKHSSKTYRNYLSAFLMLKAFLQEEGFSDISFGSCNVPSFLIKTVKISFSRKDLLTKFKQRLTTQDRAYYDVMYIPALLNNVIGIVRQNKVRYHNLIDKSLDDMKVFYNNKGDYKYFRDISQITIDTLNREVCFTDHFNNEYIMYTENPKSNIYEIIPAVDLRELSIDHDIPLEKILSNHATSYPLIYKLSEIVKNYYKCVGSDYKSMKIGKESIKDVASKKSTFQNIEFMLNQNFSNGIYKEIEILYQSLSYSIMYFPYNAAKSNNP